MSLINLYDQLPKQYKYNRRTYPAYKDIKIDIPSRILAVGSSGSMKTNSVLSIIIQMACFERYYIIAADLSEPLYAYLIDTLHEVEKKTEKQIITVSNNVADIPKVDDFDKKINNVIIFDDLITEKNLSAVEDIFIRGRKRNITSIFITQSYTHTPQMIRKNCNYVILKKLDTKRDLKYVLNENSGGADPKKLVNAYLDTVNSDPLNFFVIDKITTNPNLKFRTNFTGIPFDDLKP